MRQILLSIACFSAALLLHADLSPLAAHRPALMKVIEQIMDKAMKECAPYYSDDPSCLEIQFGTDYRWQIVRDQNELVGLTGTQRKTGPSGACFDSPCIWSSDPLHNRPDGYVKYTMRDQVEFAKAWARTHPAPFGVH